MATTPNYGFVMPDPTDFVTNLPADFEIFGDEVDSRIKALNPETTLGDISYRGSTANAKTRLPIGTSGQVLTVSGGVPAWTTPGGAAQSFTLINTGGTALSGSGTVTISGISGYNTIIGLITETASTANSISEIGLRINTDTGNNYGWWGVELTSSSAYSKTVTSATSFDTVNIIILGRMANNANSTFVGGFTINGANSTGPKLITSTLGVDPVSGENGIGRILHSRYTGTSTVSSVSLSSGSGNFDAGRLWLYGA